MPHAELCDVFRVSYACVRAVGSARCLDEERGENPGQETAQAIVQSYETRPRWRGIAWHVMTNATNTSCPLSHVMCKRALGIARMRQQCIPGRFSSPTKNGLGTRLSLARP